MKKSGAKIKHRRKTPPTVVALELSKPAELAEQAALMALKSEWGSTAHFNILLDTQAILLIGADKKGDKEAVSVAEFGGIAIDSIRARWHKHKVVRGTGDEINALTFMVDYARDFWARQAGTLYADAYIALDKHRGSQTERKAA